MSREAQLADLRALFREYADVGFPGASAPLYAAIASEICDDDDVLALTLDALPGQPAPNLLFAAVHYLLLTGDQHDVRLHYPDLTASPLPLEDAASKFRDFCITHAEAIRDIVRTRRVQTNVLERCGALLPAFAVAARALGRNDLAMVEIGASAGLNLLWDHFGYAYSDGGSWGADDASVRIDVEVRGVRPLPSIPAGLRVVWRAGVDLAPVALADPDALMWQRALMWPERADRQQRLTAAAPMLGALGVRVTAGDASELLPQMLDDVPDDAGLVVFASYALYQFPDDARDRVFAALREHGRRRPLALVTMDMDVKRLTDLGTIELTIFRGGDADTRVVAQGHPHGSWVEWLADGD